MADARRDRWGRYLVTPPGGGKPVGYTRATTVAKTLDDGGGLIPWKATATVVGSLRRPGLAARWSALYAEHQDPWYATEASKIACKKLVEECAEAGGSTDRADIGTALHALVELINLGGAAPIIHGPMLADVDAYRRTIAAAGITFDPALIEAMVVLDRYQVAGTADILSCNLPGIGNVVADLKTGTDLKYSWQAIAIQLAIYANADNVYLQHDATDGSADERIVMPELSRSTGLVIHLPAGEARCELHLIDLEAGWEAFEHSMWTRKWRMRRDLARLFTVEAPPAFDEVATSAFTPEVEGERPGTDVRPPVPGTIEPPPFDDVVASPQAETHGRVQPATAAEEQHPLTATSTGARPSAAVTPPPFDQPANTAPRALDWLNKPVATVTAPDEGTDLAGDEYRTAWDELANRFHALSPEARDWTSRLIREARDAGVGFQRNGGLTSRRFEIYRGLIALAPTVLFDVDNHSESDEVLQALVGMATGRSVDVSLTPGHALGSLDGSTARVFADAVDAFVAGRLVGSIDDDGRLLLAAAAAA